MVFNSKFYCFKSVRTFSSIIFLYFTSCSQTGAHFDPGTADNAKQQNRTHYETILLVFGCIQAQWHLLIQQLLRVSQRRLCLLGIPIGKKSSGVRSGERGGYSTEPLRPIHLFGKTLSRKDLTSLFTIIQNKVVKINEKIKNS